MGVPKWTARTPRATSCAPAGYGSKISTQCGPRSRCILRRASHSTCTGDRAGNGWRRWMCSASTTPNSATQRRERWCERLRVAAGSRKTSSRLPQLDLDRVEPSLPSKHRRRPLLCYSFPWRDRRRRPNAGCESLISSEITPPLFHHRGHPHRPGATHCGGRGADAGEAPEHRHADDRRHRAGTISAAIRAAERRWAIRRQTSIAWPRKAPSSPVGTARQAAPPAAPHS
jgi:hypothetical protein